ncbi:MAG: hypothetical protein IVW51_18010 [Thermaceae bacterium]|nr:hypothetical protein [Thermaceae bacterium]
MKKPTRSDLEGLLGAYNAHRGELPYAKTLTAERERKFLMLIEDHGLDGAGLALEQATRYLAAPGKTHDFYVQNDYGLDNMLRENRCSRVLEYAEKWQELERKRQQAQAKPARPDPLEEYRGFSRGMELDEEPEGVLA